MLDLMSVCPFNEPLNFKVKVILSHNLLYFPMEITLHFLCEFMGGNDSGMCGRG